MEPVKHDTREGGWKLVEFTHRNVGKGDKVFTYYKAGAGYRVQVRPCDWVLGG